MFGRHSNGDGRLSSVNLVIYKDSEDRPSRPGALVASASGLRVSGGLTDGYSINLGDGIRLTKGKYWLSVQGRTESGQWGWMTTRRKHFGRNAVWKNPLDGHQTGCTDYQPQLRCFGDIGQGEDFVFHMFGRKKLTH